MNNLVDQTRTPEAGRESLEKDVIRHRSGVITAGAENIAYSLKMVIPAPAPRKEFSVPIETQSVLGDQPDKVESNNGSPEGRAMPVSPLFKQVINPEVAEPSVKEVPVAELSELTEKQALDNLMRAYATGANNESA